VEKEKISFNRGAQDKATYVSKGMPKATGAVNVVEQEAIPRSPSPSWDVSFGRKCRARYLIGCDGDHVLLQCSKLLGMKLSERKEVLKKSGLCLFCLKHAAELECTRLQAQVHTSWLRLGAHTRRARAAREEEC
jgi:hypothetical protein